MRNTSTDPPKVRGGRKWDKGEKREEKALDLKNQNVVLQIAKVRRWKVWEAEGRE